MSIKIRSLTEDDVKEVSFLDDLSDNGVASMVDCEDYAWGIFVDKELIGYCTIGGADVGDYEKEDEWTYDSLLLSDVFICPEYRGNGYAKLLINEALKQANPDNEPVFLKVLDDRLASLYESLGFKYLHDGTMVKTVSDKNLARNGPFNIPGILESLKADVSSGKITIREAAEELHEAGWSNYVDEEKTKSLLQIKEHGEQKPAGDMQKGNVMKTNIEQKIKNAVKDYMTKDLFTDGYTPSMAIEATNHTRADVEQNIINDLLVIIREEVSDVLSDLIENERSYLNDDARDARKPGLDSIISDAEQMKQSDDKLDWLGKLIAKDERRFQEKQAQKGEER